MSSYSPPHSKPLASNTWMWWSIDQVHICHDVFSIPVCWSLRSSRFTQKQEARPLQTEPPPYAYLLPRAIRLALLLERTQHYSNHALFGRHFFDLHIFVDILSLVILRVVRDAISSKLVVESPYYEALAWVPYLPEGRTCLYLRYLGRLERVLRVRYLRQICRTLLRYTEQLVSR